MREVFLLSGQPKDMEIVSVEYTFAATVPHTDKNAEGERDGVVPVMRCHMRMTFIATSG
jgi:hypothetical protein